LGVIFLAIYLVWIFSPPALIAYILLNI